MQRCPERFMTTHKQDNEEPTRLERETNSRGNERYGRGRHGDRKEKELWGGSWAPMQVSPHAA